MSAAVAEGDLLWEPSESFKSASRMADFMRWLASHRDLHFETYDALWRWSVADLETFWASIVEFFDVRFARPAERVLGDRRMPGARWFEGAELNYAENVFRHASPDRPALLFQSETRLLTEMSWSELESEVAALAAGLRAMGVTRGDRVVAYMPNIPETVVAFLATASLGAIWSSCSPDFGVNAVLDRFAQIEPTVLFAVDAYTYAGKLFPKQSAIIALQQGLHTLKSTVVVSYLGPGLSAHNSRAAAGASLQRPVLEPSRASETPTGQSSRMPEAADPAEAVEAVEASTHPSTSAPSERREGAERARSEAALSSTDPSTPAPSERSEAAELRRSERAMVRGAGRSEAGQSSTDPSTPAPSERSEVAELRRSERAMMSGAGRSEAGQSSTDPSTPAPSERSQAGDRGQRVILWQDLLAAHAGAELTFEPVPFDHPLWVLYSSGTTGLPKALVHSHGGVVVEHVKLLGLHNDLRPGDRLFWYTSTGWMMWNFILGGLLVGAAPVLFDGNPAYPDLDTLWRLAEEARLKVFGTSAAYLMNCLKADLRPGERHDLSALQCIGSTGSPLPPEGFHWAYERVKHDLWLASASGGTDVVSAFVVGCPLLPVHAGELQCRALGASVDAFDESGRSLVDQTGELVITQAMPSMPIYLWNDDPEFTRYRASYFDMYPGVWRHGDWIRLTQRGSAVIQGRSDSTLNRLGVRIGTSEIYSAVESLPEIRDSLVLGLELPDAGYFMPLFVVLTESVELDDDLKRRIAAAIRTQCSPRHVPDQIVAVPAIPRTLSDKKMEVPVKKLFMGMPLDKAANVGATRSPEALHYFATLARRTSPLLIAHLPQ